MDAPESAAELDLARIARALGPTPPVAYAAAHAYPASAPAYTPRPRAARARPEGPALRLYVHVPYCNYRCTFCFFAVRVGAREDEMRAYVRALLTELEWADAGTPLAQLFVGGGTPTALPADLLDELLAGIFARLPSRGDQVHVVEGSPESLSAGHVEVLMRRGIGRVSMGTQSLEDGVLAGVHRRHTPRQTLDACRLVTGAGLVLNVDMMYGLPGQEPDSFRRDVETLAAHGLQSFTAYDLRLNERTPVDRDLAAAERLELGRLVDWRLHVRRVAAALGFTQTRWHTFKRLDTAAARHQRAPHHDRSGRGFQLGIGLSARSHLGTTVYRNHERSGAYIERIAAGESPVEDVIELGPDDRRTQYVASTLGDGRPLDTADYRDAFGTSFDADFGEPLARLAGGGLIAADGATLTLTPVGKIVHDRVMFNFYPPRVIAWLRARTPRGGMGAADAAGG